MTAHKAAAGSVAGGAAAALAQPMGDIAAAALVHWLPMFKEQEPSIALAIAILLGMAFGGGLVYPIPNREVRP